MLMETWTLLSRDSQECVVARNQSGRLTIWTMQNRDKGWRVYAIRFSRMNKGCNLIPERTKTYDGKCRNDYKGGCWDRQAHPNGIRLTVNRVDTMLLDYCEGRRD